MSDKTLVLSTEELALLDYALAEVSRTRTETLSGVWDKRDSDNADMRNYVEGCRGGVEEIQDLERKVTKIIVQESEETNLSDILRYGSHENACNVNEAWGEGPHNCDCGFGRFTGEPESSEEVRANYERRRN